MKAVTTPRTIVLWPDGAPGAIGKEDADVPTLTIYLPAAPQATGAAIVVCPGGGYGGLAIDHEGHQVARLLTSRGIAAFILKYRLGPRYHHPAMQQDVLQAIRYVRWNADELGDPEGPDRRHGVLRRRTPGVHGRHAVRRRQAVIGGAHRRRQQPAGLRRARLPRHHDEPGQHPQGLAAQPARRQPAA